MFHIWLNDPLLCMWKRLNKTILIDSLYPATTEHKALTVRPSSDISAQNADLFFVVRKLALRYNVSVKLLVNQLISMTVS